MAKPKVEGLFPGSILPAEIQTAVVGEIMAKLGRAEAQIPIEKVYYPPPNFAAKVMLKLIGGSGMDTPLGPLLFLHRGRREYPGAG